MRFPRESELSRASTCALALAINRPIARSEVIAGSRTDRCPTESTAAGSRPSPRTLGITREGLYK